jgi:hypothetical protein
MSRFETTVSYDVCGKDCQVRADFRVSWGSAATREQPEEAGEVFIQSFELLDAEGNRLECPEWLEAWICEDDELLDRLFEYARDTDIGAREDAADARYERMREDV